MKNLRILLAIILLFTACATHYRVPKSADMPEPSIGKRTWEVPKVAP